MTAIEKTNLAGTEGIREAGPVAVEQPVRLGGHGGRWPGCRDHPSENMVFVFLVKAVRHNCSG